MPPATPKPWERLRPYESAPLPPGWNVHGSSLVLCLEQAAIAAVSSWVQQSTQVQKTALKALPPILQLYQASTFSSKMPSDWGV